MVNKKGPLNGPSYFHGVFVEVFEKGILLIGPSGVGKSDIALGLLDRGHYLISDDIVSFQFSSCGKKIVGTCPSKELHGFLEVKELGILDISRLFGCSAIKTEASLDHICELVPNPTVATMNHIEKEEMLENILGKAIPKTKLTAFSGRNISLLIEAMVRTSL